MKLYHYVLLALAVVGGVAWYNNQHNVLGATSGNEVQDVCWYGTQPADDNQLYYGQADQRVKDATVFNMDNNAKCTTLRNLKPCTEYIWNLNRLRQGNWQWQWASDQHFVTSGVCEGKPAAGTLVTTATGGRAVVVGSGRATVHWTAVNGASRYYLYYKAAGAPTWTYSVDIPAGSDTYTINYLNPGLSYLYQVAALVNGQLSWMPQGNLNVTQ